MDYSKDPRILREIIMSHYETPCHKIEADSEKTCLKSYHNKSSTCIDDFTTYIKIEDGVIKETYFCGLGCAVSTSSTDMMCDFLVGKTVEEALKIINNYIEMTLGNKYDEELIGPELIALSNINNQSNRIRCSQIGVNAIKKILESELDNNGSTN